MSKETKMKKSSLILGSALAAVLVAVTGCDPYVSPNKSQPIVIGAAAIDAYFNEVVPYPGDVNTIPFPYPEPDYTWAATAFPGLCDTANAAVGITTVCPVSPFPPRTGPAYAPFYLGNNAFSYTCANGQTPAAGVEVVAPVNNTCVAGTYTASLPTDGVFEVSDVPYDQVTLFNGDFLFVQFRVLFNKLLNGKTIEPVAGSGRAKTVAEGDPTFVQITQQDLSVVGAPEVNVTCTAANVNPDGTCPAGTFTVSYVPNSAVSYFGGSISLEPVDFVLLPNHLYRVTGLVQDQQGNNANVIAHFTTSTTLPVAAPKK
jgi:hypothetical protein